MKIAFNNSSLARIESAKIAIIQSKWHRQFSDKMIAKCQELLIKQGANEPRVHLAPGALELPYLAQELIRQDSTLEAIIAFGVIVRGDTDHYQMVRDGCLNGLIRVSLDNHFPIINEVLAVHTEADAAKRAADDEFNKGIEAAIAAIEIISWQRTLRTK